jgi:endonuclease YncB( thermonuclease family)
MRCFRFVASVQLSVAFALISGVAVATAARASSPAPGLSATLPVASTLVTQPNLVGRARVLDGDTIDLATAAGVIRIRLEGIDAPEGLQRCQLKWLGTWDCGKAASLALTQLIGTHEVSCDDRGLDKYSRTLGICSANGRDLNAELVRSGLAWAFVRYSTHYITQENEARLAKAGVWQAPTTTPWDWRAQQKQSAGAQLAPQAFAAAQPRSAQPTVADAAPPGCDIKGSITKNGRIYHTTASPWYDRVRMSLGLGRRWFCTETEARDAGWRPALAGRAN